VSEYSSISSSTDTASWLFQGWDHALRLQSSSDDDAQTTKSFTKIIWGIFLIFLIGAQNAHKSKQTSGSCGANIRRLKQMNLIIFHSNDGVEKS
jgi:hypothetical protein